MNQDKLASICRQITAGLSKELELYEAISVLTTCLSIVLGEGPEEHKNMKEMKQEIAKFITKDIIHDRNKKAIFQVSIEPFDGNDASVLAFPSKVNRTNSEQ